MLLEILIAFGIAALALGVLFQAGLVGLHSAQTTARYEQAIARARSHLAMTVRADPLQAGDWRGDDGGGFYWRATVAPIQTVPVRSAGALTLAASANFELTLYAVTVRIGWHDGGGSREVRLATEHIGQAAR